MVKAWEVRNVSRTLQDAEAQAKACVYQSAKERKHRLSLDYYKGRKRATFTFCIENRKAFFAEKTIVEKFLEILTETKVKYDCKNWVYIFMPDHLHLILEGNSEKADLWETVVLFK